MESERIHRKHVGMLGESLACRFLVQRGFTIQDRNYREKWGEIDIIAEKENVTRFVEVKTVLRVAQKEHNQNREVSSDNFSPEENIHPQKIKRIIRTANSYLNKTYQAKAFDVEWQIDAVVVFLDMEHKRATMRHIESIGY